MSAQLQVPPDSRRHVQLGVNTPLTLIQGHTQVSQRRLIRGDGLRCRDRQRVQFSLDAILRTARQLAGTIQRLPSTHREWPGGTSAWRQRTTWPGDGTPFR